MVAWGANGSGQCDVPEEIQGSVVAIAAGGYHSLALLADGRVVAWGENGRGQCNVPVGLKLIESAPKVEFTNLSAGQKFVNPIIF